MSFTYAGKQLLDPSILYAECRRVGLPTDWHGKANSFRCPLGAGPGTGFGLMLRRDLAALDLNLTWELKATDPATGVSRTFRRVSAVMAGCVTPGGTADPDAAYLVRFVDRRYWYDRFRYVNKAYNVRWGDGSSEYFDATLNSGSDWTWATLAEDLWDEVTAGVPAFPGLPYAPDSKPEDLRYPSCKAWVAFNSLMARLHCAVRYDPFADTFTIVRLGDADANAAQLAAQLKAANLLLWERDPFDPDSDRLPEKLRVAFRRFPTASDGTTGYYEIDITDPNPDADSISGSVHRVFDDLMAMPGATPANNTALTTRATERAAQWYAAARRQRPEVYTFSGLPLELADILGTVYGEFAVYDRGQGLMSEVRSHDEWAEQAIRWEPERPMWEGNRMLIGKLDGDLNHNGTATMSVWAYDGSSLADTGENITVATWMTSTGDTIASGSEVVATEVGNQWYVTQAECQA